jgi:YD repeat-containing protein
MVQYQYDSLNRLISATGSGWSQGFVMDGFGNLTGKTALQGLGPVFSNAVDPAKNRLIGMSYDANGNQLGGVSGALGYDGENRVATFYNYAGSRWGYGYDPGNERMYRSLSSYDQNNGWWCVLRCYKHVRYS